MSTRGLSDEEKTMLAQYVSDGLSIRAIAKILGVSYGKIRGYAQRSNIKSQWRPNEPRHGSVVMYTTRKCRCGECREAQRIAAAKFREKRDLSKVEHGKPSTYTNWGCRCDPCRGAIKSWRQNRKKREDA